jgi:soluble lytic murein transglycosylase-like protein
VSRDQSISTSTLGASSRSRGWIPTSAREPDVNRPRRVARIAALAALALALGLLSLGCGAPEQSAGAVQVADTPAAAAVQEVSNVGAALAPVEVASPLPAGPVDSVGGIAWAGAPAEPAVLDVDLPAERPSLVERSGRRVADEAGLSPAAVAASEKVSSDQAPTASQAVPIVVARIEAAFGTVEATPTPKPVVRKAVPTPTPVRPTGSVVELPNVRPIPSAYYAAVHQWDPITNYWASYYRVDPDLIRRIIYVESKGYQYAYVASTGVKGLMQITPSWFKAGENPYDPRTNIGRGTYILRLGFDTYHTWFLAVTWYCYGPLGRYGGNVPTFYAGLIFSPIIRSL